VGGSGALSHDSAMRVHQRSRLSERDDGVIHMLVARDRKLQVREGLLIHRSGQFARRVQLGQSPPRTRFEDTVLDLAGAARDDLDAIAVLADACGSRRTSADRLSQALADRPRAHRRPWIQAILEDVESGTCSVLEHGYLTLVERPHGLPRGSRQAPVQGRARRMWQDVRYERCGVIVELDGRMFHSSAAARDSDLERDLDSVAHRDDATVRLGYGQVFKRGCSTAVKLAAVLARRGWPGTARRCANCGASDQPS
jgi:hypothetical protein